MGRQRMKTITVIACFETNWQGASITEEIEVDVYASATNSEIEEAIEEEVQQWAANYYSTSWSKKEAQ